MTTSSTKQTKRFVKAGTSTFCSVWIRTTAGPHFSTTRLTKLSFTWRCPECRTFPLISGFTLMPWGGCIWAPDKGTVATGPVGPEKDEKDSRIPNPTDRRGCRGLCCDSVGPVGSSKLGALLLWPSQLSLFNHPKPPPCKRYTWYTTSERNKRHSVAARRKNPADWQSSCLCHAIRTELEYVRQKTHKSLPYLHKLLVTVESLEVVATRDCAGPFTEHAARCVGHGCKWENKMDVVSWEISSSRWQPDRCLMVSLHRLDVLEKCSQTQPSETNMQMQRNTIFINILALALAL